MVGSRISGSSASPMRKVVWADAPVCKGSNSAAAVTAQRTIFIVRILILLGHNAVVVVPTISTPADAGASFRGAESGHQPFQARREAAVRRYDRVGRRQFAHAMTGGGMAGTIRSESRH